MSKDGKDISTYLPYLMPFFVKPVSTLKLLANVVFLQCYALSHSEAFMAVNKLNKVNWDNKIIGHNKFQCSEQVYCNKHFVHNTEWGDKNHGVKLDKIGNNVNESLCETCGTSSYLQGIPYGVIIQDLLNKKQRHHRHAWPSIQSSWVLY